MRSIALLHESPYQSDDLGLDMRVYLDKLVFSLSDAHGGANECARFSTRVDDVYLPLNVAVSCGLIVNELVTNALKHAFANARDPQNEIRVEITKDDACVSVSVADNGVGFPTTGEPCAGKTMGLTLVHELSRQLRGRAELATNGGGVCCVRFPLPLAA